MKPLAPLKRGPKILRAWLNAMRDAVIGNRILRAEGYEVHEHPGGTQLILDVAALLAGSSSSRLPLQPYDASAGATPKIKVAPGTFGGNAEAASGASVPTISGTRIDAATPPALTLGASDILIYLEADVDVAGLIAATSIHSTAAADPPAGDATVLYVRLASVAVTIVGGTARVAVGTPNLRGSQTYELCGGVVHLYSLV